MRRPSLLRIVPLGTVAFLALAPLLLSSALTALAAGPTIPPLVSGKHVYDTGGVLTGHFGPLAESLAADIEAAGGGKVVVYTTPDYSQPSARDLVVNWQIDGLLIKAYKDSGDLVIGGTLNAKLSTDEAAALDTSPGPASVESWILSTLARVDAFVRGKHVFDGAGVFTESTRDQAEAAARSLGDKIHGKVYVDIAIATDSPETTAFFNAAHLSSTLAKPEGLIIGIGVNGTTIGGTVETEGSDVFENYHAEKPWSGPTLSDRTVSEGDQAGAILDAINGVSGGSMSSSETGQFIFWIIFLAPFTFGPWLINKLAGVTPAIKAGIPGDAVVESIGETGITVTMPSVGPDAPDYKLGLQVTPSNGGAPYHVDTKALIPRVFIPMMVPGVHVGVLIDPKDPQKVALDYKRIGGVGGDESGSAATGEPGGMDFQFDANGTPSGSSLSRVVAGVQSGTMPTQTDSAAHLLATGTHGTAVITSCQPLGKKVRELNPKAELSHLNDPVWLFTLEVTLAGEKPFPAVFGHRVPQDVAIDWDKSPIG